MSARQHRSGVLAGWRELARGLSQPPFTRLAVINLVMWAFVAGAVLGAWLAR